MNDLRLKILGNYEISENLKVGWRQNPVPSLPCRTKTAFVEATICEDIDINFF